MADDVQLTGLGEGLANGVLTYGEVKFSKAASAVCRSMISGLMSRPCTEILGMVMGLCNNPAGVL